MTTEADERPMVPEDFAQLPRVLRNCAVMGGRTEVDLSPAAALVLARMIERDLAPRPAPVIIREVPDGWALRVSAVVTLAGWTHTMLSPLGRLIAGWIHG